MEMSRATLWLCVASLLCSHRVLGEDQHVLFLGNSFSFFNGGGPGVWHQYKQIAEACIPDFHVYYQHDAHAAWTLNMASKDPKAIKEVRDGVYDLLIIQDQSGLNELEEGLESVKNWFAPQARDHHARLGLYQTWSSPKYFSNLTGGTEFLKAYYTQASNLAKAQGADVVTARAGEAFLRVLRDKFDYDFQIPDFHKLYFLDFNHPSYIGHNLAAWTMVLSFNREKFTDKGCDATRVPNVAGQSTDWKFMFAQIACELAGLCPQTEYNPPNPPLEGILGDLQGDWVRKKKMPAELCHTVESSDCTFLETWRVNGTWVYQISQEGNYTEAGVAMIHKELVHHLHVAGDSVKMIPEMSLVHQVKDGKVWFEDCLVLTRPYKAKTATIDECWCMGGGQWKDYQGSDCGSYAAMVEKGYEPYSVCNRGGTGGVTAMNACPGCGKCHIPWVATLMMDDQEEERRLSAVHV